MADVWLMTMIDDETYEICGAYASEQAARSAADAKIGRRPFGPWSPCEGDPNTWSRECGEDSFGVTRWTVQGAEETTAGEYELVESATGARVSFVTRQPDSPADGVVSVIAWDREGARFHAYGYDRVDAARNLLLIVRGRIRANAAELLNHSPADRRKRAEEFHAWLFGLVEILEKEIARG